MEQQVTAFLHAKGIELDTVNIEAYHRLPWRNKKDKPVIIIWFANRKHNSELLKQGRRLKGSDVCLNENPNGPIPEKQKKIQSII